MLDRVFVDYGDGFFSITIYFDIFMKVYNLLISLTAKIKAGDGGGSGALIGKKDNCSSQ
jgi:hypothetical protein